MENSKEEPKYPIGGYAPGNYTCKCINCNKKFIGDKRAVQCEPCAIEMMQEEAKERAKNYMSLKGALEPEQKTVNLKQQNLNFQKQVMNPYYSHEYGYTVYEKGFVEGYEESVKFEQEQDKKLYSEEDLIQLLNFVSKEYNISNGIGWFHTHESLKDISSNDVLTNWLKQFKKK
jgi:hypothetical protein